MGVLGIFSCGWGDGSHLLVRPLGRMFATMYTLRTKGTIDWTSAVAQVNQLFRRGKVHDTRESVNEQHIERTDIQTLLGNSTERGFH